MRLEKEREREREREREKGVGRVREKKKRRRAKERERKREIERSARKHGWCGAQASRSGAEHKKGTVQPQSNRGEYLTKHVSGDLRSVFQ